MEWISKAIQDQSLVVVMDGSCIRQLCLNLCSVAFVLECAKGCKKIIRSFSESTLAANEYRGDLLGQMAIHLLLVSLNRVHNTLVGSVEVVSDCLGALRRVVHLLPYQIPLHCKHSDILKNICVNCRDLTFILYYLHIKAYKDDNVACNKLSWKLQLNCICNHLAKQRISKSAQQQQQDSQLFPLEPISIFIKGTKLSSSTGQQICFHAHCQLAKALFLQKQILSGDGFKEVGWELVHATLYSVRRLFQLWALKHLLGIAGTMKFLANQDNHDSKCPSCLLCKKTCCHIVLCPENGRTKAFQQSVAGVNSWIAANATHPNIKTVVTAYALGRGQVTCLNCAAGFPTVIQDIPLSQDKIGWKNFMMGMISSKLISIQESHLWLCAPYQSAKKWATGLNTQLLQVTHAQWIYPCLLVHDCTSDMLINLHKTKLLEEIENQLSMGAENLMEDEKYLLEHNLLDQLTTNGEQQ
jgi:hypothetical protein